MLSFLLGIYLGVELMGTTLFNITFNSVMIGNLQIYIYICVYI